MSEIDLSIVIPAYNEAKRLPKTLKIINDYFVSTKYTYEILVVDDGSRDKTSELAKSVDFKNVKVLAYKINRGKGYAVNYGVTRAQGKYVIFVDADNSTPFKQIEKLLEQIDEFPVVIGSRYLHGSKIIVKQPLSRRIGARLGNLLIRMILLPRILDTQCGFKMFQHDAAKEIFSRQTIWRWGFDIEILYIAKKLGFQVKEVSVEWYNDTATKIQSPLVFISTLSELFRIKLNSLQGKYRR
jgi:dolichyl-phosphate beta-glucosyltransferase